jgi:ABC-type amino acid transport substrate-binding protein
MRIIFQIIIYTVLISSFSCKPKSNDVKIFIAWPGVTYLPNYDWKAGESKPTGVEPAIIERILEVAGYDYTYVPNYNYQEDGDVRIDVILDSVADISIRSISINSERDKLVDFSDPYYYDGVSALVLKKSDINTREDLNDVRVIAIDYTTAHQWAKENLPDSNIYDYTNYSKQLTPEELLRFGKVDAYLNDRTHLKNLSNNSNQYRLLSGKYTKEPLGIAVREGNTKLLNDINLAIRKLKASGELSKLTEKFEK